MKKCESLEFTSTFWRSAVSTDPMKTPLPSSERNLLVAGVSYLG
jgi:hypothetical protein